MRRYFLLLLIPFASFSQIMGEDEVYLKQERLDPKFNGGGMKEFSAFIHREFDQGKIAKEGEMIAAFTIDTDGAVKNIKIVQIVDTASAMEMIRVLNACPKWQPASRNGKPISIDIRYPMKLRPHLRKAAAK